MTVACATPPETSQQHAPLPRVTGWAMWRDGRPVSPEICESKESLLIGYDMIPLRGLDVCEQRLANRGMVACLTDVAPAAEGQHHYYAVTVCGGLRLAMLAWSVCSDNPAGTIRLAAGYLAHNHPLPETERNDLMRYWISARDLEMDGRRRNTLSKLTARVMAVLAREQVVVCTVALTAHEAEIGRGETSC